MITALFLVKSILPLASLKADASSDLPDGSMFLPSVSKRWRVDLTGAAITGCMDFEFL